jgi:hypothetical protein
LVFGFQEGILRAFLLGKLGNGTFKCLSFLHLPSFFNAFFPLSLLTVSIFYLHPNAKAKGLAQTDTRTYVANSQDPSLTQMAVSTLSSPHESFQVKLLHWLSSVLSVSV